MYKNIDYILYIITFIISIVIMLIFLYLYNFNVIEFISGLGLTFMIEILTIVFGVLFFIMLGYIIRMYIYG